MPEIIGSLQRWSGGRFEKCKNGNIQEGLTERQAYFTDINYLNEINKSICHLVVAFYILAEITAGYF